MSLSNELKRQLEKRAIDGNLRMLKDPLPLIDFYSNDYLGLSGNRELSTLIRRNYDELEIMSNGATGSRLLSGNSNLIQNLEQDLAELFEAESALIFNSGYVANLAVLSSIAGKNDTIIYDEKIHVCLKEGARLSKARYFSFKHNHLDDLQVKLKNAKGNKIVVIESVYSMDGDQAPLEDIFDLCKSHQAHVLVDEAHSTGIYGHGGNGLLCQLGLANQAFVRIYTFGKAMGVHGACVVGDHILTKFLVNFARPFIYTTALPPHSLISIQSAFEYLAEHQYIKQDLRRTIDYFTNTYNELAIESDAVHLIKSKSAIQALIIPGNGRVKSIADKLVNFGFDIRPILSPTVKAGEERIRICLHSFNSENDIYRLLTLIKKLCDG